MVPAFLPRRPAGLAGRAKKGVGFLSVQVNLVFFLLSTAVWKGIPERGRSFLPPPVNWFCTPSWFFLVRQTTNVNL